MTGLRGCCKEGSQRLESIRRRCCFSLASKKVKKKYPTNCTRRWTSSIRASAGSISPGRRLKRSTGIHSSSSAAQRDAENRDAHCVHLARSFTHWHRSKAKRCWPAHLCASGRRSSVRRSRSYARSPPGLTPEWRRSRSRGKRGAQVLARLTILCPHSALGFPYYTEFLPTCQVWLVPQHVFWHTAFVLGKTQRAPPRWESAYTFSNEMCAGVA